MISLLISIKQKAALDTNQKLKRWYSITVMLLRVEIEDKIIGNKHLLNNLQFFVDDDEKIGVVGRNGVGKTTLFNVLAGTDTEFEGSIDARKGLRMIATQQEHHGLGEQSAVEYILTNLPHYARLKHVIDNHPGSMGDDMRKIHEYSDALERYGHLNYYDVEDRLLQALAKYQINEKSARLPMTALSGGQKRFVELLVVQFSEPDLALIDEPTNHMDYIAKAAFIAWLEAAKHGCLVITHDRDVLAKVNRIIELKDKKAVTYKGNYEAYLKQNTTSTTNQLQNYEIAQKTMANLKSQIVYAIARAPGYAGKSANNPFIVMRDRLRKQLKKIEDANPKPSFWIDQESAAALNPKTTANYEKFKAKNIKMGKHTEGERATNMLTINGAQLGYDGIPLFDPVSFSLQSGERLHIVGRNGAGKTTLVRAIAASVRGDKPATIIKGTITPGRHVRFNMYEQEMGDKLLDLTLYEAIENIYRDFDLAINPQSIMRSMGDYLFEPAVDAMVLVRNLSGGQKARLQLIRMLINKPNLLILDEPTNHLDLPSIEELENALKPYHGAIIYISHDSYFARNIGGKELKIGTS
ncbi:ABC-F family ATP-binding cassette domain-containing protein [Candidatus Saccharibacteria bacterium]|nr:ABC-F family ATP-binding cassette domain-containing protein [Candidatus Saccharibacteria bacterium]